MKIRYQQLFISLLLPFIAGITGSLVTFPSLNGWYTSLHKPSFNPPNWVFGPVWTVLYLLMGLSLYLFWQKKEENILLKKTGFSFFVAHLMLNIIWSVIFFGLHSPLGGVVVICSLFSLIFLTIIAFYHVEKKAAYLLIPYLLWVAFATLLNLAIVGLN